MKLSHFFYCLTCILALAYVGSLFTTYAPQAEEAAGRERVTLLIMTAAAAGMGILLSCFPTTSWVHHYKPLWLLWVMCVIGAVAVLLFVG